VIHRQKTGTPPRCDLIREKELHDALHSLIHSGDIRSAHDCSEGSLAVALAECCISRHDARGTHTLLGADVDLTGASDIRLDALLYGEAQGRILITVKHLDAVKVAERAKLLGVSACRIGTVGGASLQIKTHRGEVEWPLTELHDRWWNSIARAMRESRHRHARHRVVHAEREVHSRVLRPAVFDGQSGGVAPPGLSSGIRYSPTDARHR
jgi:phosphoribosylformylglycinamidine synthase